MGTSRLSACGWLAALAIIAGASAPVRAGFAIRDLGVIIPSGTSGAQAINASGEAAGMVTVQGGGLVAARSSGGGGLTQVSVPPGALSSMATSINAAGEVAGYYTDKFGVERGFYTAGGQASVLSPLSLGGQQGSYTQVNGINGGGQMVGTGDLPSGVTRAFISSGGTPTAINPLGSGSFTQGNGINDSGTVVGTSEIVAGGLQHAFYTNAAGAAVDLLQRNSAGSFHFNTYGMAIADNGDIIGHGDVGITEHGFFAPGSGGALVDLGTLPGASSSFAMGLNNLGLVVGSSGSQAFLWSESLGEMFNLNALLSTVDQSHWLLTEATGINDSGQISGEGYLNGVLHGFVLDPIAGQSIFSPAGSVPAPPALVLSSIGLAIVLGWSRLRTRLRPGRTGGRADA